MLLAQESADLQKAIELSYYDMRATNEHQGKLGCCDIEKISNIDIEKKIPVISIFFCLEIIRIKI